MRERLRELADNSVDAVVTDPPYHLASIVKRFGSPSAAPLNNADVKAGRWGPYHRTSSGFMGQTWDGGDIAFLPETWAEVFRVLKPGGHLVAFGAPRNYHRLAVAIEDSGFELRDLIAWLYGSGFPKNHRTERFLEGDDAEAWAGWGTALKPAIEPIALARKPLSEKSVAANAVRWGTGALNIEAARGDAGRHPANVAHDGSDEVVDAFPVASGGNPVDPGVPSSPTATVYKDRERVGFAGYSDNGSAARFFYCAKASNEERGDANGHPTVKPVALMAWLIRLVTPPGGLVVDPFLGSGTTGIAADICQRPFVGIELSPDYLATAERRMRDRAGLFGELAVDRGTEAAA